MKALCLLICVLITYVTADPELDANQCDQDDVRVLNKQIKKLNKLVEKEKSALESDLENIHCNDTVKGLQARIDDCSSKKGDVNNADGNTEKYLRFQTEVKYEDCQELYKDGYTKSGVYQIWLVDYYDFTPVYCDMDVGENKGWITIQRRTTFTEDFDLSWEDYKLGFGSPSVDHWIGLRHIRALTLKEMSSRGGKARLRIDVTTKNGENKFAEYGVFSIGQETESYAIQAVESYQGDLGDRLQNANGTRFSTADRNLPRSCDSHNVLISGGWWFSNGCTSSNLNGKYFGGRKEPAPNGDGKLFWGDVRSADIASVSMKVQRYLD